MFSFMAETFWPFYKNFQGFTYCSVFKVLCCSWLIFKPFYCCLGFCSECSHSWPKPFGHFIRIFRVLHTVQFSRFCAVLALLSDSFDSISCCVLFVKNFFKFLFDFFPKPLGFFQKSVPVAWDGYYNTRFSAKCQQIFSFFLGFSRLFFVLRLSRTFLNFFLISFRNPWVSFRSLSRSLGTGIRIPDVLPNVNIFFHFFCVFHVSFFCSFYIYKIRRHILCRTQDMPPVLFTGCCRPQNTRYAACTFYWLLPSSTLLFPGIRSLHQRSSSPEGWSGSPPVCM